MGLPSETGTPSGVALIEALRVLQNKIRLHIGLITDALLHWYNSFKDSSLRLAGHAHDPQA